MRSAQSRGSRAAGVLPECCTKARFFLVLSLRGEAFRASSAWLSGLQLWPRLPSWAKGGAFAFASCDTVGTCATGVGERWACAASLLRPMFRPASFLCESFVLRFVCSEARGLSFTPSPVSAPALVFQQLGPRDLLSSEAAACSNWRRALPSSVVTMGHATKQKPRQGAGGEGGVCTRTAGTAGRSDQDGVAFTRPGQRLSLFGGHAPPASSAPGAGRVRTATLSLEILWSR